MSSGGFQVDLFCLLWDLVDEGVEDTLDRIKGETGVTGVVVHACGRAIRQFRPHPGVSPRSYHHKGGALFQPDPARYGATRIRPAVAERIRKSNPLKAVVEACRARGLQVGCSLAACNDTPTVERHEHAAVRDALGDPADWLCPVNPDVQEYVRSLVSDLTANYPLDSIRLADIGFPWSSGGDLWTRWGEHRGFVMGPVEVWLRSICFCESCRQLARRDGVDVDAAIGIACDTLENACRTGAAVQDSPSGFVVRQHAALTAYLEWRTVQLHRWLATLKTASGCLLAFEEQQEWLCSGISLEESVDTCDILHHNCQETTAEAVDTELARLSEVCPPPRISLGLGAGRTCVSSETLVAAVARAAQSGCHAVVIGDYGSIPLERLDWIRQAVRFARREAV